MIFVRNSGLILLTPPEIWMIENMTDRTLVFYG